MSDVMTIGFDAKRLYNNFTGLGNYSRTLVGNMMRYFPQDEYLLYTPKFRRNEETESFLSPDMLRQPSGGSGATWRSWGVKQDLKRDGVQIYHGLSHDLPFGIERSGIRSVVTIHDVCYKTFPEMFPRVERMIYDVKYRHACRHSDRIIAISESTKRDIVELLDVADERVEVVYQAMNPVFYHPQPEPVARAVVETYGIQGEYVLYVGSINSRKNLLAVVRAYELLNKDMRLPLVVIGSGGSYKDRVMEYARRYGIDRYMTVIEGLSSMVILQAFYQCASLFVYPSFYEGFGLPVTEALLCGTPVITSSVSSLPEAAGDAAAYVDPTSAEHLARKIETVLGSATLRAAMIERGLKYAHETFDARKLTEQVHKIYNVIR